MSNAYYPMKLIDFCMKYDKTSIPLTHKDMTAQCPGLVKLDIPTNSGRVKLVLWAQPFPGSEMMRSSDFYYE